MLHPRTVVLGVDCGEVRDLQCNTGRVPEPGLELVEDWSRGIAAQLTRLLSAAECEVPAIHANNLDWIGNLSAVELLRDLGKHFSVNTMLARESVRTRLGGETAGLSFTEFSYSVLQAYDFQHLYDRWNCRLQVGGSDQWGNITAGLDLLRRTGRSGAFGMTTPLVTRTDGKKFGKTEKGALWLDPSRTSPFALYQYFLNVPDADVSALLRQLTLLPRDQITMLESRVEAEPERRDAQRALARAVIDFVHGPSAVLEAERITHHLFTGGIDQLNSDLLDAALVGAPTADLQRDDLQSWETLFVAARLAPTKSSARRTVAQGGAYLNERRIQPSWGIGETLGPARVAVLRRGPRTRAIVRLPR